MAKFIIKIKDRQTGKIETVSIEASNRNEARAIAMQRYGISHEVL